MPIEDSALFYNHSQEIEAKIYNKLHDLDETERKEYAKRGLIRFELSLKHARIKELYDIGDTLSLDELPDLLCRITDDGAALLDKYIVQTLYPGAMLSRSVLKNIFTLNMMAKKNALRKCWDTAHGSPKCRQNTTTVMMYQNPKSQIEGTASKHYHCLPFTSAVNVPIFHLFQICSVALSINGYSTSHGTLQSESVRN